jgi:hypothetical protein
VQFGRIGGDRDPWLTRRLWLHAAVAAPLIATAVAGAAIAIYVGFGGEAKAEKNVPLSGVGVLAGAVYAAAIARCACDPQLRQDPGMSVYDSKGGFQRWAS